MKVNTSKMFKSEDSRFYLKMGFKFLGISFINTLMIYFLFSIVIDLNKTFFISQGFNGADEFKAAYYDFVYRFIIDRIPYILAFNIFTFFCGAYTASVLIRPFKTIALYCSGYREDGFSTQFEGDRLSEYKIFQSFSELFFKRTNNSLTTKEPLDTNIPKSYVQVRDFESNKRFIFSYLLLFSLSCILSIWFVIASANEIQSATLELAFKLLPANKNELYVYLNNSQEIWSNIVLGILVFMVFTYFLLVKHIYGLVYGASLGYFLTMKSFLKGNYTARVHLVGFKYIRPYARHFNKYLDFFCRELKITEKKE